MHDAITSPLPHAKQRLPADSLADFEDFTAEELAAAAALVHEEALLSHTRHSPVDVRFSSLSLILFLIPFPQADALPRYIFCPTERNYVSEASASAEQRIEAVQFQFDAIREKITQYSTRVRGIRGRRGKEGEKERKRVINVLNPPIGTKAGEEAGGLQQRSCDAAVQDHRGNRVSFPRAGIAIPLSLSLTLTHTHIYTQSLINSFALHFACSSSVV